MMPSPLPLLSTTVIGSYALPSWLYAARELIHQGKFGRRDIQETLDDAVVIALSAQEQAGVDIISDGEMRRFDFIFGFYDYFTGLRTLEPTRKMGPSLYDSVAFYEVVEQITAPQGPGLVEEFTFAWAHTAKPLKICCPGPLTIATPLKLQSGYKNFEEVLWNLTAIVNTGLKNVVAAGADYIQVDEPNVAVGMPEAKKVEGTKMVRRELQG